MKSILLFALCLKLHAETGSQSKIIFFEDNHLGWVDNRLTYVSDGEGNHIPEFSHSGYRGANADLPMIPNVEVLYPENGLNSGRLQEKIDQLPSPGALVLMPGLAYELDKPIHLNKGGIVLRGIRDEKHPDDPKKSTVIHFKSPGSSAALIMGNIASDAASKKQSPIVSTFVPAGTHSFEIKPNFPLAPGDRIIIRQEAFSYYRTIKTVVNKENSKVINLNAPVFHSLDANGYICKDKRKSPLKEIGLENLNIIIESPQVDHAILLDNVQDSWICGVFLTGFAKSGIYTSNAAQITFMDCSVFSESGDGYHCGPRSCDLLFWRVHAEGGQRAFFISGQGSSSGIVFLDSTAACYQAPSGGELSSGVLFDNVHFTLPDGDQAIALHLSKDNPQWAAWSVAVPNNELNMRAKKVTQYVQVEKPLNGQNYCIGCDLVNSSGGYFEPKNPLEPGSLYEAQLSQRIRHGEILDPPYLLAPLVKKQKHVIHWLPSLSLKPEEIAYDVEGSYDGSTFTPLSVINGKKNKHPNRDHHRFFRVRARQKQGGNKSPYSNQIGIL
jgi:hypothetical protein